MKDGISSSATHLDGLRRFIALTSAPEIAAADKTSEVIKRRVNIRQDVLK
jgi:hypothetical protein